MAPPERGPVRAVGRCGADPTERRSWQPAEPVHGGRARRTRGRHGHPGTGPGARRPGCFVPMLASIELDAATLTDTGINPATAHPERSFDRERYAPCGACSPTSALMLGTAFGPSPLLFSSPGAPRGVHLSREVSDLSSRPSQRSGEAEGSLTRGTTGRAESSPDNGGTYRNYQTVRVRLARPEGVTRVNQWLKPRNLRTGSKSGGSGPECSA
jgi:hypothetical protein